MPARTIWWADERVHLIDQTKLPLTEETLVCADYRCLAEAIRSLRVRGAPAIGVAAAYAVALAAREAGSDAPGGFRADLERGAGEIRATRPTAVNLFWGVQQVLTAVDAAGSVEEARAAALATAHRLAEEDIQINQRLGEAGADLIPPDATVLTHCNAGALATVDYGTALGVIRSAYRQGRVKQVFADETRPVLQGARLTTWELAADGIPVTLITDNMAGHFMQRGEISCVIVGADRIAANGDVANKIGTYSVAVLAQAHGIPFYVAAPVSTFDLTLASGAEIPIEERAAEEVTHVGGVQIAPEGISVRNPAFDVTPHRFVSAIVTERGVLHPPYSESIRDLVGASVGQRESAR